MTPELQDDELLRSYLLGKLPDEDADRLERRLLAEDDLFDLAEAVEFDLLAAVDRGALTAGEREQILRRLAGSPGGRERLALARSLNALAAEKAGNGNVKPFRRRAPAFPPPMIRWIALAASLVVLAGLSWFALLNGSQASKTERKITATSPAPTPQPRTPVPQPTAISPTPQPPQPNPHQPAAKKETLPTAVLTLTFLTSRGAEEKPRLELAPKIRRVEIQIDEDGLGEASSFDAVVRNQDQGSPVWEKKGLRLGALPWGRGLALKIPAERLPAGLYEVAVTPQGGEPITQEFEVVKAQR